jgi:hypothetical protein
MLVYLNVKCKEANYEDVIKVDLVKLDKTTNMLKLTYNNNTILFPTNSIKYIIEE